MSITRRIAAGLAVVALGLAGRDVAAQQSYPQTLYWGTGLIDIPVAYVSPLTGDFALNYAGKAFERGDPGLKINYNDRLNSQLTFSMSAFGRVEAGVAFVSSNPEYGFFGQALLLNEQTLAERGGLFRWIPSVAVGVRNVGPYEHLDRFGVGYDLLPPDDGSPNYQHRADDLHQDFDTRNTVYGVVTKGFTPADLRAGWPSNVAFSLSLGYGNGLFKDDGGLDSLYSKHDWGGMFGGVKVDFQPTRQTTLSLMAENNAWDYNVGASLDYRGIRAGVYWTELGGGSADATTLEGSLYNYSKFAFTLGWQSNVFALLRGDFLRGRVAELERRREGLLAEIASRQQRIQALELEINRIEAQNLLELEQRRAEAEAQLRQEREALQRLEERLRILEGRNPPPTTNPPAGQPPRR
jgi:hypothetical protein